MRFCTDCGKVLNIFGDQSRELCPTCIIQMKKSELPPARTKVKAKADDLLDHTVLSLEGQRIVLRSEEGWELWSGSLHQKIEMKTLRERARRIYEIRLKRQRN